MKKFLIVGLGNIGEKYANTRHNIGFQILDALAKDQDVRFETEKLGDITRFRYKGKSFILLKPSTFMNLSGKAVKYWMTKEKIQLENICIVTDDKNIDFGAVRIKTKGSAGGHNGLKDIQIQMDDALAECDVEIFSPDIGADFKTTIGVADNPEINSQWHPDAKEVTHDI